MNWEAIGAVGEVLGSLAVLVTLAYLAIQVRHARDEVARSVRNHRSDTVRELELFRAGNSELAEIYSRLEFSPLVKSLGERLGLTESESLRVIYDQLAWWQYSDQVISDIEDLSESDRHQFNRGLLMRYGQTTVGAEWFERVKENLNPRSATYVEALLRAERAKREG